MASLAVTLDDVEQRLERPLAPHEHAMVAKMYRTGMDTNYIVSVLAEPEDPEPSDDELITTRYEATVAGPQDITGVWG
jgi:hypothetical protein